MMLQRQLGTSDIRASVIGYGCWKAGKAGWPEAEDRHSLDAVVSSIIVASTNPEHIEYNVRALQRVYDIPELA